MEATATLDRPTCSDPVCLPEFRCEACVAAWLAEHHPEELTGPLWARYASVDIIPTREDDPAPTGTGTGRQAKGAVRWGKWGEQWALRTTRTLTEGDTVTVTKANGDTADKLVGPFLGTTGGQSYYAVGVEAVDGAVVARWRKRNDEWVLAVPVGSARPGDTVTVRRSSGEEREATLGSCVGTQSGSDLFVEAIATEAPADGGLDLRPLFDGLVSDAGSQRTDVWVADPAEGSRLKLRISAPVDGKWAGWVFVSDGAAYGSGRRYGAQRPGQSYDGDVADVLARIVADRDGAFAAYGRLVGSCGICSRPLEDEESVARGVGPVCWARLHG